MELTKDQLKQLLPKNQYINHWHKALSQLLPDYEINTPQRIAAFIAQCAHESGGFVFLTENLNYRAESLMRTFPKYFKTWSLPSSTKESQKKLPIEFMLIEWATATKHQEMVFVIAVAA